MDRAFCEKARLVTYSTDLELGRKEVYLYSPSSHYGLDVVPKTPNFIPALKYGHLLVVSL